MSSTRNASRRQARQSPLGPVPPDTPWAFLLNGDNPSESQLIAIMVAILAGCPISELIEDPRQ